MFVIDSSNSMPPFEQLRTQVLERVSDGQLVPGSQLPTVRALAAELGIAPNTVARAYRELEASGILETRGRNGTFVSPHGKPAEQELQRAARAYAEHARELGIAKDAAIGFVSAAIRSQES